MKYKTIFYLHIKKCAGTSIRAYLGDLYKQVDRKIALGFEHYDKQFYNDILNNYRIHLGNYDNRRMLYAQKYLYSQQEFDLMYKFTVVRNPQFRILSAYLYLTRRNFFHIFLRIINKKLSFFLFLSKLPEIWDSKEKRHIATHTFPIFNDITDDDGNLLVDEVFKIEKINDLEIIKQYFPLQNKLKHLNKGLSVDYKKYYDARNLKWVHYLYKSDFSLLNYDIIK